MIEPKALRLGNYINTPFGIKKVTGITTQPAKDDELFLIWIGYDEHLLPEHCSGIALMPEIMEKAGLLIDGRLILGYAYDKIHRLYYYQTDIVVNHLHHLQNLLFSVKQQELPISL